MAKSAVEKGKALVQSKTFWFNLLAGIVAVASLFGFREFEASPEVAQVISTIVAIVNIWLRVRTKLPITKVK